MINRYEKVSSFEQWFQDGQDTLEIASTDYSASTPFETIVNDLAVLLRMEII